MENSSNLDQTFEYLCTRMDDLKYFKDQMKGRVAEMNRWLQKVKDRENKVDELRKAMDELNKGLGLKTFTAKHNLNKKVLENLHVVEHLEEEINAGYQTVNTSLDKVAKRYSNGNITKFITTFSNSKISGNDGDIYTGQFDGKQVAVKVLPEESVVDEIFITEVNTIARASHRHVVKLYGFCFEGNMRALVYEYMENGPFDKILYQNHLNLAWEKLYSIAIETAKGIVYLHDGCGEQIIHHDIRAHNVLLDEGFSPKIADFGLSKILKRDVRDRTWSKIRGIDGYAAPEMWLPASRITAKCDIYSYGMMLFDILGKRKNGIERSCFPNQVWEKFKDGQLDQIVRDCGIVEKDREKAAVLTTLALWCVQMTPEIRPSMSDVVMVLEKQMLVKSPPNPFLPQALECMMIPLRVIPRVSPTIHESLAISNPTLVAAPDVFINAFEEEKKKYKAEKNSDDEQAITYLSEQLQRVEIKTSSEIEMLLSELGTDRPQSFSHSDIQRFTSNFSEKIGSGGYGVVYKGQFLDGMEVAVKVLRDMEVFDKTFKDVVMRLKMVNHPNIVKLLGYVFDGHMKALVYEYVNYGSMDMILYRNRRSDIDWDQLYEIAIETAKGLSVLHAAGIIHHDIKASNILLDSNLSPKIRSYGLKELIIMKTDNDATRIVGSCGYISPETWIPTSEVTYRSDIYSFGMLLFEVLGRRCISSHRGEEWFPAQIWQMFDKGLLDNVRKECGINKKDRKKAFNLSKVALWCAQFDPQKRPSMSCVVEMLEMKIPVMDPPNPFPYAQLSSTSSSPELSPRFYWEASPSTELSFHGKGYPSTDSEDDSWDGHFIGSSIELSFHGKRPLVEKSQSIRDMHNFMELLSSLHSFDKICPPGGENSVVLYTAVGWQDRFTECNYVRSILMSNQVEIIERDISANSDYWVELRKLLGRTEVPVLFVHGKFIGGVNEVKSLEEEGKLKLLVSAIPVEHNG